MPASSASKHVPSPIPPGPLDYYITPVPRLDCQSAGGLPGEQGLRADQERAHHSQRNHRPVSPHLGKPVVYIFHA